ncbi:hypothetical protein EHQ53_10775 [Leptospira langatensis]|uniref:Uncharacterized protein n=1 Tax=Leptospira langatensis TaxID=2484983 RepID=A0A5F1ZSY6_9LEPT|nr:hypothetical protein EHO57_15725 [Leptospira langatensis]TGL40760.1 hypothetical protein EHQ53_10775 [Leptospira langatensis]
MFGRLSALLLFYSHGIPLAERRISTAQALDLSTWYSMHTNLLLLTLFSFLNGLAFLFLENAVRKKFLVLLLFSASLVVTFFTADSTRVFSNLFYPAWISVWLLRAEQGFEKKETILLGTLLALGLALTISLDLFYKWGSRIIYLKG